MSYIPPKDDFDPFKDAFDYEPPKPPKRRGRPWPKDLEDLRRREILAFMRRFNRAFYSGTTIIEGVHHLWLARRITPTRVQLRRLIGDGSGKWHRAIILLKRNPENVDQDLAEMAFAWSEDHPWVVRDEIFEEAITVLSVRVAA